MKPLLAATVEKLEQIEDRYPLLASPKLDGIRCIKYQGKLVSRNLKAIPNEYTQRIMCTLPEGVDGELIVGDPTSKSCFRDTTSGVMSADGEPDVTFYAFDVVDEAMGFERRYELLKEMTRRNVIKKAPFKIVPHTEISSGFGLTQYEEEMLERGYEGVMLREPDGLYKFGRSTLREGHLMKLKRFMDSEAVIIGVEELMHNMNEKTVDNLGHAKRSSHKANKVRAGVMGALKVRDVKTKVEFDIGTGFTAEDRAKVWKKGTLVKYKYFPSGSKDKPRFPVFLGVRDKRDI